MGENGTVKLYLGAEEKYVGDYASTEDYELHSISYSCNADGVAVAAYNDQATLHSLSPSLTTETFVVLEHAARDPAVEVLIWTATGERAFSSGAALRGDKTVHVPKHALEDYAKRGMLSRPGDMVMAAQTIAFWDFPKPLIAAVNGLAVGGGANIALANYADMVLCSTNARFKYPFADLGLTPELGSSLVIPFLVGMSKAKEIMMIGEWFSAEDAVRLGLANEVVEPDQLMARATEIATDLTTKQADALRLAKRVMNRACPAPWPNPRSASRLRLLPISLGADHLPKDLEEVLAVELETIMEAVGATGGFDNAKL